MQVVYAPKRSNRRYSKVNKSIRAEVAVIFSLPVYCNYTFCVVATMKKCELVCEANSLFDCCNNTERIITLNRK
jgi:hypothetical protein